MPTSRIGRIWNVVSALLMSLTLMFAAWCHVAGLFRLSVVKHDAYKRALSRGGVNAARQAEAAAAEEFGIPDYLKAGLEELPNIRQRIPDVSTAAYVCALPILAGVLALVRSAGDRKSKCPNREN